MNDGQTYCSRCNWPTNKCRCTEKELREFTQNMKIGPPIEIMTTNPDPTDPVKEVETPTPRTNEYESTYAQARMEIQRSKTEWMTLVPVDFARQLERELATANLLLEAEKAKVAEMEAQVLDKKHDGLCNDHDCGGASIQASVVNQPQQVRVLPCPSNNQPKGGENMKSKTDSVVADVIRQLPREESNPPSGRTDELANEIAEALLDDFQIRFPGALVINANAFDLIDRIAPFLAPLVDQCINQERWLTASEKMASQATQEVFKLQKDVRQAESRCEALSAGLKGCVEALNWCLGMDPSPCRCMDFATPPHVCFAHRALEGATALLGEGS